MIPVRCLLLILLMAAAKPGATQTATGNAAVQQENPKIDARLIAGFWETTDSVRSKIEFVDSSYGIHLKAWINFPPYFFSKDVQQKIPLSGYIANWPPFNCELKLVSADTLSITYSQLGVPSSTLKYVRSKE